MSSELNENLEFDTSMKFKFEANENNTYKDYFSAYYVEYRSSNKTKKDIYKEHLQTASKDKLIDIAIEGNNNYVWANNLAYERGLEIKKLKTEVESLSSKLSNNISISNRKLSNYKTISSVAIGVALFSISTFYIYQFIKYRLKKYAEKIRQEAINEFKTNKD